VQTFTLTEQHIKLLQNTYVTWYNVETGAPAIDPKRPYGNSYVAGDIAEILDVKLPEDEYYSEEAKELHDIHRETETALQIILQLKTFEPGVFEKTCPYTNEWKRIK